MIGSFELNLCNLQGRLFRQFCFTEYDEKDLTKKYMTGELGERMDSEFSSVQWFGESYVLGALTDSKNIKHKSENYDPDALFWVGYIYRYWHFLTGESSAQIYRQTPFDTMVSSYYAFHTLSSQLAIDNLKEISGQ